MNSFQAWAIHYVTACGLDAACCGNWVVITYPDGESVECMSEQKVSEVVGNFVSAQT